jgi:hypothetical protein
MEDGDTKSEAPGDPEREALILEVARQVYDETRYFVIIPEGMKNQIYRYGIMSKKTTDGRGKTRAHGSRNYWKE